MQSTHHQTNEHPPPGDHGGEHTTFDQFVTFYTAEECFAFPMRSVLEIIRVPRTIQVPLSPPSLVGLANLRGSVLPVLDLRSILSLPSQEYEDATRVVVVDSGRPIGLVVDRVARVLNVDSSRIEKSNTVNSMVNADLITGVVKDTHTNSLVQILDVNQLVASEIIPKGTSNLHGEQTSTANAAHELQRNQSEEEGDYNQLINFVLNEQEYAFEIRDIEEIVRIPDEISHVPRAEAHVLGLINLRGRLLPLVSLRQLFNMRQEELQDHNRVLVISVRGKGGAKESVGVVVDGVKEVLSVSSKHQTRTPSLMNRHDELSEITSICRLNNGQRIVSVLSSAKLLEHPAVINALESGRMEARMKDMQMYNHETRTQDTSEEEETQLVVFNLSGEEYGVTIEAVQEIVRVPELMNRVPKTANFIEGIINLRGTVLPVLDMRTRFGLARNEPNDRQRILVLNLNNIRTGFVVDSVTEVLRLSRSVIEKSPHLSSDQARIMGRVANLKESKRMIMVLETGQLLDNNEVDSLAQHLT